MPMKILQRLAFAAFAAVLVTVVSAPVQAQGPNPAVIKPSGLTLPTWLPDWLMPPEEKRARKACAQNLPTCRAAVRRQMETEMAASLVTPWLMLGVGILIALLVLRAREKAKTKQRESARRHHDPRTYRKLGKTADELAEEAERKRLRDELAR